MFRILNPNTPEILYSDARHLRPEFSTREIPIFCSNHQNLTWDLIKLLRSYTPGHFHNHGFVGPKLEGRDMPYVITIVNNIMRNKPVKKDYAEKAMLMCMGFAFGMNGAKDYCNVEVHT